MSDAADPPDPIASEVTQMRAGDKRALTSLIGEHLCALRAYVRLNTTPFLRNRECESDIVQSVLREVLQNDQFEYRGVAQFKCWLFQAVLFRIRDKEKFYRAERRGGGSSPHELDAGLLDSYATILTPSRVAEARDEIARLERAFESLRPEEAELLSLAHIAQIDRPAIAEHFGISGELLNKRLSRAKIRLLRVLEGKRPGTD